MRRRCSNTMREVGPRAVGGAGRAGGDIRETEAGAWKDRGERGVRHARQQGATAAALGGEGDGRLWFGRGLRDSAAHATSQHSGHGRVGKHLASGERKSGVLSRETVFVAGVTVGWAYPGTGSGWRSDPGDPPVTGGQGEEHPQRGRGVCEEEPAASLAAEGSRPMRTENGPAGARWASLAGWGQGQAMLHGAENGGCT